MTDEEFNIWNKENLAKLAKDNKIKDIRPMTQSNKYYDDEIRYIYPNGDIHLKDGVHRLSYNTHIKPDVLETHINDIDLKSQKTKERINEVYSKEDGIGEY